MFLVLVAALGGPCAMQRAYAVHGASTDASLSKACAIEQAAAQLGDDPTRTQNVVAMCHHAYATDLRFVSEYCPPVPLDGVCSTIAELARSDAFQNPAIARLCGFEQMHKAARDYPRQVYKDRLFVMCTHAAASGIIGIGAYCTGIQQPEWVIP
jgi:hypothetical protein